MSSSSIRTLALCAVAAAVLAAPLSAQQDVDSRSVKIDRVVLYKHGVGYFERSGKVTGNAVIRFQFKESEMKDLLKSFYALDLGGGKITTIAYDSQDPLQKRLADIRIEIPPGSALSGLLHQLQGVQVELQVGGEKRQGRVLGLEPMTESVGDKQVTRQILIFQQEDGAIQHLAMFDIQGVRVLDEGIARDLNRLLTNLPTSRYGDRKKLSVRTEGQGEREIAVGYILETPIWKTSYRLLLEAGKDPLLQGWAIVDNTTEEDWEEVNLTLIGGSPISFVMDLYTPFYPARPRMDVASQAAVSFKPMEPGADAYADAEEMNELADARDKSKERGRRGEESLRRAAPGSKAGFAGGAAPAAPARESLGKLLTESIETAAKGTQVGELFQYEIKQPVNIQKGSSGLVPILMEPVKADRVLYFSKQLHATHPMHALHLTNSTALTLESGPITVFESNTCAGESLLARSLKSGLKELLAYSVETACTIDQAMGSRDEQVHQYTLANGLLVLRNYRLLVTNYKIFNQGDAATLFLDHPKQPGFTLKEPAKPEEDLPAISRWKIALEAKKNQEFTVQERTEIVNSLQLAGLRTEDYRAFVAASFLKEGTRKFFEELAASSAKVGEHRNTLARLNEERTQLANDQNQVRNNLATLRQSPQEEKLREGWLAQLQKMDQRSQEIRGEEETLRKEIQRLEREMKEKIAAHKEE